MVFDREAMAAIESVLGPPGEDYWDRVRARLPLAQRLMFSMAAVEVTLDSWVAWRARIIRRAAELRIPDLEEVDQPQSGEFWYAPAAVLYASGAMLDGHPAVEGFFDALDTCAGAAMIPNLVLRVNLAMRPGVPRYIQLPDNARLPFETVCLPLFAVELARCTKHLWIDARPPRLAEADVDDRAWRQRGTDDDRVRLAHAIHQRFTELLPIANALTDHVEC